MRQCNLVIKFEIQAYWNISASVDVPPGFFEAADLFPLDSTISSEQKASKDPSNLAAEPAHLETSIPSSPVQIDWLINNVRSFSVFC